MSLAVLLDEAAAIRPLSLRAERQREIKRRRNALTCPVRPQYLGLKALRREADPAPPVEPEAENAWRPETRADCADVPRPCPYVACRHHLYLDVTGAGSVRLAFPHLEPGQMPRAGSCSLDVAEAGDSTLAEVAGLLNVSRERIRQMEGDACAKIRRRLPLLEELTK